MYVDDQKLDGEPLTLSNASTQRVDPLQLGIIRSFLAKQSLTFCDNHHPQSPVLSHFAVRDDIFSGQVEVDIEEDQSAKASAKSPSGLVNPCKIIVNSLTPILSRNSHSLIRPQIGDEFRALTAIRHMPRKFIQSIAMHGRRAKSVGLPYKIFAAHEPINGSDALQTDHPRYSPSFLKIAERLAASSAKSDQAMRRVQSQDGYVERRLSFSQYLKNYHGERFSEMRALSHVFNPIMLENLRANPKDIFFMLISDKNPLFNYSTIQKVLLEAQRMGFNVFKFIPTGTLQDDSMRLDTFLENKPINEEKIRDQAFRKEIQNTSRGLLSALTTLKDSVCFRNKVKSKRMTPKRAIKEDKCLNNLIQQLNAIIAQEAAKIKTVRGLPILPESILNSEEPELVSIVQHIQQIISLKLKHLSTKTYCKNFEDFQQFIYGAERQFPDRPIFQVDPWSEIEYSEDYQFAQHTQKIAEMIASEEFKQLVSEVLDIRLNHFADTNLLFIDRGARLAWMHQVGDQARSYVSHYLYREIIYFQTLIDKSHQWMDRRIFLAYPMQSPIGKAVFKFVFDQNREYLAQPDTKFAFVDTSNVMMDKLNALDVKAHYEPSSEAAAGPSVPSFSQTA